MNVIQKINVCALLSLSVLSAKAQTTYMEMEQLTVNDQVTTVITASEPIRFVDISTDKVVGDQPINNTIRLKPKDNVYADGEVLAIVTIVTERYRTQYALLYTTRMQEAVTDKEIECSERNAYNNPAVSLSTADMSKYARQIWSSAAKYRNVATKMHRMVMRLNNIYSVGEYFFIDFSVENKTNIRFDIDEMRIKSLGFGCLYERGLDVTLSYEHETKYHNAWEYFANGYIKWDECASCGHVCPESFWNNYRSYGFGFAYKPCVARGRNHHGNMRIGASAGSDTDRFLGGIHLGYEHNYTLRHGWKLFWQVKTDVMIKGEDLFRTGIVLGVKLPVK